jgi:hypothetical protein
MQPEQQYDGGKPHLMWKGCGRQYPRCGKTGDFDLLIIPENRQLALACINHYCCSACARAFYDKSNADRSQFHMGFHRLCPVCSGSFQLRLPVKGAPLQLLVLLSTCTQLRSADQRRSTAF